MNSIPMLSSILGLSFASGVNLYAAVLVVGLGQRFGWISGLPGDLSILTSPLILSAAGVMYFLEFFADKIPYVSVAWDSIHTVIRPLGAAALALASAAKLSPEMQGLAMLAGGTIALGSHSTKMGYRLIGHASPEPVSDSIFSVAEDVGVVGLVLLTYKHPLIAVGVSLVLLAGIALALPFIFRLLSFALQGVIGRIASWFSSPDAPNAPPAWLSEQIATLGDNPAIVRCFARRVPKVPWVQQGYLVTNGHRRHFAFRGWFGPRLIPLDTTTLIVNRGLLFDQAAAGDFSVYLTKDCSAGIAWGGGEGSARFLEANR